MVIAPAFDMVTSWARVIDAVVLVLALKYMMPVALLVSTGVIELGLLVLIPQVVKVTVPLFIMWPTAVPPLHAIEPVKVILLPAPIVSVVVL